MTKYPSDENTSYVFLNGGLGNQLFGLAAALYSSKRVMVLTGASVVNCREDGQPQIFNLRVDDVIKNKEIGFPARLIAKKVHNYLLTAGLNSRSGWLFRNSKGIVKFFKCFFAISSRNHSLIVSDSLGYTEIPRTGKKFLIGYFQSYKWLNDKKVENQMKNLFQDIDERISPLIELAKASKPIVVHVRLGDYKLNPLIGILPQSYFVKALEKVLSDLDPSELCIWVFSDEPSLARERIPPEISSYCRWISEEFDLSAEETLALMRYGSDYVISNSTFSWWAATLTESSDARVIYPKPWFANGETPFELIPSNWIPISGHDRNETERTDK